MCQRPRCWYFRNEEFVCYKKGGNRCFAPAGENQYHAIFGNDGPAREAEAKALRKEEQDTGRRGLYFPQVLPM